MLNVSCSVLIARINMEKLPSYGIKKCCNSDCYKLGENKNEPCWGEICAVDEIYWGYDDDSSWIHSCEGHYDQYDDKKAQYKRSYYEQDN